MIERTRRNVIESLFGEILYNVKFNEIVSERACFSRVRSIAEDPPSDIKNIRLYGVAIAAAEIIKEKKWILTKSNTLVCCDFAEDVVTLSVNILIDENLAALNSTVSMYCMNIWHNRDVEILGLNLNPSNRLGMWCLF